MEKGLSSPTRIKLDKLLSNAGDMSLKRRAYRLILDLNLKEDDHIIDLGCGDGFFLYLLNNLPIRIKTTGIDQDEIVLRNARKNLLPQKVDLVKGSIAKMLFKSNTFKKAIMTEVLEHVDDDKKALSEVYRILKSKGILVLTVPSYNFPFLWDPLNWILQNIFGTHIGGIGFFAGIWARHKRLYKKKQLLRLLQNAGFKIDKTEELTTRCLPFNHYLVNIVARLLLDSQLSAQVKDPLNKFKNTDKPIFLRFAFFMVNLYDKLNEVIPGKHGLNIYVKATKR